jgi:exodeoxyribonuclease VII large subunit
VFHKFYFSIDLLPCEIVYSKSLTVDSRKGILKSMDQPPLFSDRFWTVSQLTTYIRKLLEKDLSTQDCWVKGEISNLSRPASGHIYFTLKDSTAALRCVVWRTDASRIRIAWVEGAEVEVHGRITVYEVSGQYQLVVDAVQPVGEGFLFQEFLNLKARLEGEGLFDPEHKRPIPELPRRIGIVTSATGAAVQDMINTIKRRYPIAEVIISPTPVQGVEAPPKIIAALKRLITEKPDVIIISRGGGSLEDLWAFNDENVVRAIARCPVPVVTGIGHETDFTLSDFAADLRAPTPTAAAELVTPNSMDLITRILGIQKYMLDMVRRRVQQSKQDTKQLIRQLKTLSPLSMIQMQRQMLDDGLDRIMLAVSHQEELQRIHLNGLLHRLASVNPETVVNRGYAIVTKRDSGHVISSIQQIVKGDKIDIRVKDGSFDAMAGEGG